MVLREAIERVRQTEDNSAAPRLDEFCAALDVEEFSSFDAKFDTQYAFVSEEKARELRKFILALRDRDRLEPDILDLEGGDTVHIQGSVRQPAPRRPRSGGRRTEGCCPRI